MTEDARVNVISRALLAIGLSIPMLCKFGASQPTLVGRYLLDDTFYFIRNAENFWTHGFYTFDGVTATNGYQPLWQWLVTAVSGPFVVTGASDALPYAVIALSMVVLLACAQIAYGLTLHLSGSQGFAFLLIGVLGAILFPDLAFLNGMESPIWLLTFLLLVRYVILKPTALWRAHHLAALAAMLFFARLDSVLFLVPFFVWVLTQRGLGFTIRSGLILVLISSPYLAYNYQFGGTILPISGKVKGLWAGLDDISSRGQPDSALFLILNPLEWADSLIELFEQLHSNFDGIASRLSFGLSVRFGLAILLVLVACSSWIQFRAWREDTSIPKGVEKLPALAACWATYVILQSFYYENFSAYVFFQNYRTIAVAGLVLLAALPLRTIEMRLGHLARISVVALVVASSASAVIRDNHRYDVSPHYGDLNMEMANWVDENVPQEAVLGSWAAGLVAYYSHRNVVQLEGLVQNFEFLSGLREFEFAELLLRNDVSHIAQHFPNAIPSSACRSPGGLYQHLRRKPIQDFSEAFREVHRIEKSSGYPSNGYVFEIDKEKLAANLAQRDVLLAALSPYTVSWRSDGLPCTLGLDRSIALACQSPIVIESSALSDDSDGFTYFVSASAPIVAGHESSCDWSSVLILDHQPEQGFEPLDLEDSTRWIDGVYRVPSGEISFFREAHARLLAWKNREVTIPLLHQE